MTYEEAMQLVSIESDFDRIKREVTELMQLHINSGVRCDEVAVAVQSALNDLEDN